jgi:hypothetical protein
MTRRIALSVNDKPIELDYFVQSFIDHITGGIVEALEGTGEIKTLDISIEASEVRLTLNGVMVPMNAFASKIVMNTISGMISSLKGVGDISRLNISIERTG